jgi:hypothetical protein
VLPLMLLPADPAVPVPPEAMPEVETLKSGLVALARNLSKENHETSQNKIPQPFKIKSRNLSKEKSENELFIS